MPHRVAFLGFTEFERKALTSYFRLAHHRSPSYEHVATLTDADFLVADADHAPSVQLVEVTERLADTVFIGARAPAGAAAWMRRPIDALQVMRELDAIVARQTPPAPAADVGSAPATITQAMRRRRSDTAAVQALPPPLLGDLPFSAPLPEAPAATVQVWPPRPMNTPDVVLDDLSAPLMIGGGVEGEPAAPPLTLRELPTTAERDHSALLMSGLFPGGEGLVGHENPPPRADTRWTEDLSVLSSLPVLQELAPSTPAAEVAAPVPAVPSAEAPPPAKRRQPPAVAVSTASPTTRPAKPPKPPKVPKATLLPGHARALLVDDSAIARLFLEKRLARWQLVLDQAASSQAAWALLAQHSYDLVFLDVELGEDSEQDGLGLCRQIKQTPALMNTLVVMLTAHHSELDRVRGALAGCDAYLGKPLAEKELQQLIERQGVLPRAAAGALPG